MDGLQRFFDAQQGVYPAALEELRSGRKQTHWMWFIFPQIAGLGHSHMARIYAIADMTEAQAYFNHDILGARLIECTRAMLVWQGKRSAVGILGEIDALKFASSMTLFEAAGGDRCFADALEAFCDGKRDSRSLELIG